MKTINERIFDLEEEIERLRAEKQEILKSEYPKLVGMCFKQGEGIYDRVTSLFSVDATDTYTELRYECIRVEIDVKRHEFVIDSREYGSVLASELKDYVIPRSEFEEKVNECLKLISDYDKSI